MKVRIYKQTKNAMQSGRAKTGTWVLEYVDNAHRGPDPLMGWTATDSTLPQVKINFSNSDAAVSFAQKKGWDYEVEAVRARKVRPRNYGDNFCYRPPKD